MVLRRILACHRHSAAGYEKEAESMGHIVADPYDSQNEWWTTGDDFDNESDLGNVSGLPTHPHTHTYTHTHTHTHKA